MKRILSRDNPHFKALKKLCRDVRQQRKHGVIFLDGMHLLESCIQSGGRLEEIVVSQSGRDKREIDAYLTTLPAALSVTLLADSLFDELAWVETPSGILAIAVRPRCDRAPNPAEDAVLLDGLQDPGNVGSILRSTAAAGFHQVLLTDDCAQAWSPKVLRAAMGAHFQLDVHEGANLGSFLDGYRGQIALTALDVSADLLYDLNLSLPTAWVFGNEGLGVRPELAAGRALRRVRIPMPGASESLNVAAAAGICLFETVRQRLLFKP